MLAQGKKPRHNFKSVLLAQIFFLGIRYIFSVSLLSCVPLYQFLVQNLPLQRLGDWRHRRWWMSQGTLASFWALCHQSRLDCKLFSYLFCVMVFFGRFAFEAIRSSQGVTKIFRLLQFRGLATCHQGLPKHDNFASAWDRTKVSQSRVEGGLWAWIDRCGCERVEIVTENMSTCKSVEKYKINKMIRKIC